MPVRTIVDALLIVDAQVGLLVGVSAVPDADGLVQRMTELLHAARSNGAPIIHLQNDGAPGTIDEPGAPGWPIHPLLSPIAGETLIRKTTDDGFDGTALAALLTRLGIHRIAIAGLLSEMCVSATARTALSTGYTVVIPHDAHGTYDLSDIPHHVVWRVAEHALGDQLILATSSEIDFAPD